MSKKFYGFITAGLIVATMLWAFPRTVSADGGEGGSGKEVNGYHITLSFAEPVKAGENQFHIQITDALGMPVTNAEVKVSAMSVEEMSAHDENSGMEMATEAPSVGVMTSNSGGMDMATEVPATGVMKPNKPTVSEDALIVILEPTKELGEYAGKLSFDTSGEWTCNVHFTVNGETTKVEFPVVVTRTLGLNYGVLAGFFGINATVIATAAALKKRKPVVVRK